MAIGAYGGTPIPEDNLPSNPAHHYLAAGLARGHHEYGNPQAIVLFVVQDPEPSIFGQRWLEYLLLNNHGIRTVRKTLREIALTARLRSDGTLVVPTLTSDSEEISLVYFRAGYSGASEYPSNTEWQARRLIELSRAIKCPTIATQLAGCKKVQQMLANPGVLERCTSQKCN
jgi:glutathione synthase